MFARILIITGLVSTGLLLIILTTTTPAKAGAFGILAVFLLSYISSLVAMTFIVWSVSFLTDKALRALRRHLYRPYVLSLKKSYYFSTVLALGPVIIVSLRSVGGGSVYDFGLVVLFMALGCLYISRRTA
jgi:hypothetical protein